jgi:hypothetical protein
MELSFVSSDCTAQNLFAVLISNIVKKNTVGHLLVALLAE